MQLQKSAFIELQDYSNMYLKNSANEDLCI
jgi:hypothetical protein